MEMTAGERIASLERKNNLLKETLKLESVKTKQAESLAYQMKDLMQKSEEALANKLSNEKSVKILEQMMEQKELSYKLKIDDLTRQLKSLASAESNEKFNSLAEKYENGRSETIQLRNEIAALQKKLEIAEKKNALSNISSPENIQRQQEIIRLEKEITVLRREIDQQRKKINELYEELDKERAIVEQRVDAERARAAERLVSLRERYGQEEWILPETDQDIYGPHINRIVGKKSKR